MNNVVCCRVGPLQNRDLSENIFCGMVDFRGLFEWTMFMGCFNFLVYFFTEEITLLVYLSSDQVH